MRLFAFLLLVCVGFRYMGAKWLAPVLDLPVSGANYVLAGLWEALLCLAVILLLENHFRTRYWWLARAAMCIGVVEGSTAAACRIPIKDIQQVPQGADLCDYVTGLPVTPALYATYLIAICWGAFRK